eukprot:403368976
MSEEQLSSQPQLQDSLKIQNNFSLLDRKYIMNIKSEGNFAVYVKVAARLLKDPNAQMIQLSACGSASLQLFKVSSILSEYFPELHKMTYFTYSTCYTCQYKKQKHGNSGSIQQFMNRQVIQEDQRKIWVPKDSKDTSSTNQTLDTDPSNSDQSQTDPKKGLSAQLDYEDHSNEEIQEFIKSFDDANFQDICQEDFLSTKNNFLVVHNCNDPRTFSCLITMNQRLAFRQDVLDKKHPGYSKPTVTLKNKFTLEQLIQQFSRIDDDDKPYRQDFKGKFGRDTFQRSQDDEMENNPKELKTFPRGSLFREAPRRSMFSASNSPLSSFNPHKKIKFISDSASNWSSSQSPISWRSTSYNPIKSDSKVFLRPSFLQRQIDYSSQFAMVKPPRHSPRQHNPTYVSKPRPQFSFNQSIRPRPPTPHNGYQSSPQTWQQQSQVQQQQPQVQQQQYQNSSFQTFGSQNHSSYSNQIHPMHQPHHGHQNQGYQSQPPTSTCLHQPPQMPNYSHYQPNFPACYPNPQPNGQVPPPPAMNNFFNNSLNQQQPQQQFQHQYPPSPHQGQHPNFNYGRIQAAPPLPNNFQSPQYFGHYDAQNSDFRTSQNWKPREYY